MATLAASPCQAASFATVHVFDGLTDGRGPTDGLVNLGGVFYGVASSGGDWGWGTLFKYDPASNTTTPLHNFSNGQDGAWPVGGLVAVQGMLYGTTTNGVTGNGTIFSVDPASGTLTTLYTFSGGADGGQPLARLIAVNGLLYGTTAPYNTGSGPTGSTIFSFDPATATKTILYSFLNNGDGVVPQGALLAAGNWLFGTTSQGTVFRLHLPDLKFTTLHDFGTGAGNGPFGGLLLKLGGLYGTISSGGAHGCGAVFKTDPSTGTTAIVHSFDCGTEGGNPGAGLVAEGAAFAGTTRTGGAQGNGTAFELDPATGAVHTIGNFPSGNVNEQPSGPLLAAGGLLYGLAAGLGASNAGVLFSADPASGALTTLYRFSGVFNNQSGNSALTVNGGMLYGTSGQTGAAYYGSIYQLDPVTGAEATLYSFTGGADGSAPAAPLLADGTTLLGTTPADGVANYGTVFSYDITAGKKTILYSFGAGTAGSDPGSAGVVRINTSLFGVTGFGGNSGSGTVYRLPVKGGAATAFNSFEKTPELYGGNSGLLSLGGALYGTRCGAVDQTAGVAYKTGGPLHQETVLHAFATSSGGDGLCPGGGLIYAGGTLYGTTQGGGAGQYYGTIYSLNPATGTERIVYSFTGGSDGGYPLAALVQSGGFLYGTTSTFGVGQRGTVFQFNPHTGVLVTLHAFTGGADGGTPSSALIRFGNLLYGTTSFGSLWNRGTVFSVAP